MESTLASPILLLLKIGLILFLFIYVIFAGIIIKQARIMTETLELGFETQVKLIVFVHFLASVLILILATFIL